MPLIKVGTIIHAVSFHMKNIYEKLEVHSKSEAVAKALLDRIGAWANPASITYLCEW